MVEARRPAVGFCSGRVLPLPSRECCFPFRLSPHCAFFFFLLILLARVNISVDVSRDQDKRVDDGCAGENLAIFQNERLFRLG